MVINGSKNSYVFLTGASGFIGKKLVRLLLDQGYKVRVLLNASDINIKHKNLDKRWGKIENFNTDKYLKDVDCVVHLAAYMGSLKDKNFCKYKKINFLATKRLYLACKRRDIRLIYCSSIVAKYEVAINDWYAKSKLMASRVIINGNYKNWVIVYPTAVVDIDQIKKGKIPGFLMTRVGSGSRIFNIVDVKNLCTALKTLVNKKSLSGEYILGGLNISVAKYLKESCKIANKIYIPFRLPKQILRIICRIVFGKNNLYYIFGKNFIDQKVNSTRAIEDFKYNPKTGLEQFIY